MTHDADPRQRFEVLFDALYEPLQRYARRRTDESTADDIVADALLVVWRRLDEVPAEAALPWAYRVAGNCLANARRGDRRRRQLLDRVSVMDQPAPSGEEALPDPAVHDALRHLGDTDREIVRLWAWEGLGPGEIAVVVGLTPNAVSIRLHRAKAKLADRLRKEPGDAGHDTDNREEVR